MNIAYKETKDEFEDPDEEIKRIYVTKLFTGIQDWNFGLFLQELFKNEYKVRMWKMSGMSYQNIFIWTISWGLQKVNIY